jgi:hypothetical protein
MAHYCENEYCGSVRSYWADEDEGEELLGGGGIEASKWWREDHHPAVCAEHGGDCGNPAYHAAKQRESDEADKRVKDALWGGGKWWRDHHPND